MAKTRYHYFSCPEAGVTIGLLGDDPKLLARQVKNGIVRGKEVFYVPDHPSELNDRLEPDYVPKVIECGKIRITTKGTPKVVDDIVESVKSMIAEAFAA